MRATRTNPDYGIVCGRDYRVLMGPGRLTGPRGSVLVVVVRLDGRKVCVPARLFATHAPATPPRRIAAQHPTRRRR